MLFILYAWLFVWSAFPSNISNSSSHTLANHNLLRRSSLPSTNSLNLLNNISSFRYSSKYHMSSIKPWSLNSANIELTSISVGSSIGHSKTERFVFEIEVLIGEFGAVDWSASSAVVVGEVTALDHEIRNNSVEWTSSETDGFAISWSGPSMT